jgi:acetyltransferase
MDGMARLLDPRAIAVVGASPRGGPGRTTLANLRAGGFGGEVFAINPGHDEVLGYRCYPAIAALPAAVDCVVIAVAAEAACAVLEEAYAQGTRAAVVLGAGFGEGGHGEARAQRLRALAAGGMAICGPNCFGVLAVKNRVAAYSGVIPAILRPGPVALVSQSGSLVNNAYTPLMEGRELGFSYVVSCGNQTGTTIEAYFDYFVDDPDVTVMAAIVEGLKDPRRLAAVARRAHRLGKTLIVLHNGRSAAGRVMVQSHTGALVGDAQIFSAFLRRCGIVEVASYEELTEAIELFAIAPRDDAIGREIIVISGSGGAAAAAADVLDAAGTHLATLQPQTQQAVQAALPEFGSVTNPIDGTGAMFTSPTLLPKLLEAVLAEPGRPLIAANVTTRPVDNPPMRRFAATYADAARASGRTVVAFQASALGGPLDLETVRSLHAARVPVLLGLSAAMRVLGHLGAQRDHRARMLGDEPRQDGPSGAALDGCDFLAARAALVASGVAVVDAVLAASEDAAVAAWRRFAAPVAVKAEAPGLLHKSDQGCVRLDCSSADAVRAAYRDVVAAARQATAAPIAGALIQPMVAGIAEAYAGIIVDPQFGPAVCFGLGGIFVEILNDVRIELAPLGHDDAPAMIAGVKGAGILMGARNRPRGDIEALATLLVNLSRFALGNAGRLRALDLNPIIVKPAGQGVVAVDIAIEGAAPGT